MAGLNYFGSSAMVVLRPRLYAPMVSNLLVEHPQSHQKYQTVAPRRDAANACTVLMPPSTRSSQWA